MLFVSKCSHISDEISVTDTDDGITESYTANEVYEFAKRVKIKGVKDGKIIPISQSALAKKLYERYKLVGLLPSGSVVGVDKDNVYIDMPEVEDFSGGRVRVPFGVNVIICECFNRYSSLRHLELPQSIKIIESKAFCSCGIELNCLNLSSLVHIGDEAFLECHNIKSLVLDDELLFVGNRAFAKSGVERIEFRSKDLVLREKAFFNCKQLKEITVTEDSMIKSSDMLIFADCTSLEKVDLGFCSGMGSVPAGCFDGCDKLSQVVNADKVIQINYCAFKGCSALKSFDFSNIEEILSEGFCRSGLKNIYCPKLTFIGSAAFENIPLQGVVIEGCAEELKLSDYAFTNCNKLSSFHYNGVVIKAIYEGCFKNCSSLKDIDLGTKVRYIGDSAFKGCVSLEDLGRLQVIEECENEAFSNTSLKHLDITYELDRVGEKVFRDCKQLEDVSISIKIIGYNMFYNCIKLERFDWRLPEGSNGYILKGAFRKCRSLKEFKFPSGVVRIDEDAFEGCDELSQVYIPNGVDLDSIKNAFKSCPKVKFIIY